MCLLNDLNIEKKEHTLRIIPKICSLFFSKYRQFKTAYTNLVVLSIVFRKFVSDKMK